ncbi:MAG: MATE family efflux transporter [Candidatus Rhabdochlamydia sp.]
MFKARFSSSMYLTQYPLGSLRELFTICWPLIISLLFVCMTNLMDRFFLEKYSLKALEACSIATYLILLFQVPCIRIASMSQVFVGQYKGAKELYSIGSVVWQAIWFSLLSALLTIPLGLLSGAFFFPEPIKVLATNYFHILIGANFLFPLGSALSTFFTGQGRSSIVSYVMLISSLLHLALDLILIFGIPDILPPQGIKGAAYATIISQFFYCLVLFCLFLRQKERDAYRTDQWQLNRKMMKQYILLGTPTAVSKLSILSAWVAAVKIITARGGDYLLVLSVTGNLCIFFSCFTEGIGQSLLTIASYLIGSDRKDKVLAAAKSAFCLLLAVLGLLAFCLLLFPKHLLEAVFFTPFSASELDILVRACHGLWLFFLVEGVSWIGLSILTACADTRFLMYYNAITSWLFTFFPIYCVFYLFHCPPYFLWAVMTLPCSAALTAYLIRIYTRFPTFSKVIYSCEDKPKEF